MRLLVVEDEKKLCDMIAKSLHQAGYEVDTCNDGEEALDMIYAEMYDLIVLDLNLPGMDGMDILRELRKENEETKVLILSARSQIADKVDGLDAGANDYMEKPFHLQELEARVRSLTRRKFVQKNVCLECGSLRELVTNAGSSITKTTRITYFRYRRGFSFAVENFLPGILCSRSWNHPNGQRNPQINRPNRTPNRMKNPVM